MSGIIDGASRRDSGVVGRPTEGLTHCSSWYLDSTVSPGTTGTSFTLPWSAESNGGGYGRLGAAPTNSGGVFTYPCAGIWFIDAHISFYQTGSQNDNWAVSIAQSANSGSNWYPIVRMHHHMTVSSDQGGRTETLDVSGMHRVNSTATERMQIRIVDINTSVGQIRGGSMGGNTLDAADGGSFMTIMRLSPINTTTSG